MKVVKLTTDDEMKQAYEDANSNIYFREGSTGDYELMDGYSYEEMVDASTFGFEFVSMEGPAVATIPENDVEFEEIEMER